MDYEKLIAEQEARLAALDAELLEADTKEKIKDVQKRGTEIKKLIKDIRSAQEAAAGEARISKEVLDAAAKSGRSVSYDAAKQMYVLSTGDTDEKRAAAEERGKKLKEGRSVTIASTGVILPGYQATDIKPTFNQVSSLVDMVNVKILPGGNTFEQPYSTGYGEGGYTTEGGNPTEAEATFGSATIGKSKITAYAEDSEELVKLPGADYDGEVQKGIRIALRKKLNKEILIGDGAAGHFIGIFDDGATAIVASTDLELDEIDEDTLDDIVYSFGGDEDVEDAAVLTLNKADLKAFAMLRDANGKKLHDIKPMGNKGTIDTIPYVINSACKAVSSESTTTGQYCMAYGPPSNYTMAIFSDIDITRSTDYKFKEGMIANKGVVYSGGNVTAKNGFLRVKKA